ncbi:MAG: tetratricopeptide repeat protein [Alphaproteobacteria bacterium]|nr:tetratricopeptide repeat protein [Alphaproteobacteria bacterium]
MRKVLLTDLLPSFYPSELIWDDVLFTPRQFDILSAIYITKTPQRSAELLGIRNKGVEAHIFNIKQKLPPKRRDITHFIDTCNKSLRNSLNKHYKNLLVEKVFRDTLNRISSTIRNQGPSCKIKEVILDTFPIFQLEKHLLTSGIKIFKEKDDIKNIDYFLHIVGDPSTDISRSLQKACLILSKNELMDESKELSRGALLFDNEQSYYLLIFTLLKILLSNIDLDIMMNEFEEKRKNILEELTEQDKSPELKNNPTSYHTEKQESSPVHSDMIIPVETALLKRPSIINKMNHRLRSKKGINAIALVGIIGIGGAGKTTLARYYGHSQKNASIVWELNAETRSSLIASFQDLARALAKKDELHKELETILQIQNQESKEKQLLIFVKQRLKENSNWVLIYDNFESVTIVQDAFPQNTQLWGNGRVIITTRNSNIHNTSYITRNNVIQVEELSPDERLTLFSKILYDCEFDELSASQKESNRRFLKNIPPFPLDVSTAAYYIKNTGMPYEQYLKRILEFSERFEESQKNLLIELSDYTKTRYGIITSSLDRIINLNNEYTELLFLISLLDSQNIPKDLLIAYKNDIVVGDFIYNLKRHSLITSENSGFEESIASISLHRSIQNICLCHLVHLLSKENKEHFLKLISPTLEKYIIDAWDKKDVSKMKLILNHGQQFIGHHSILYDDIIGIIGGELGIIYFYLGRVNDAVKLLEQSYKIFKDNKNEELRAARYAVYIGAYNRLFLGNLQKAKELIENGLKTYEKFYGPDHIETAKILMYLGMIFRSLGKYNESLESFKRSLDIYERHYGRENIITAEVAVYLGRVYTRLGFYSKSLDLIKQALESFESELGPNHIETAWASVYLAEVYGCLGYNLLEKELLEKSHIIYELNSQNTYVSTASILVHLGKTYASLGDYKKAKSRLELAVPVFEKKGGEKDYRTGWALLHLGHVLTNLGNYKKGKDLLQKALEIFENNYGKEHIETARVLLYLGENCLKAGYIENGLDFVKKSFQEFQRNNHPSGYVAMELLAKLYLDKFYNISTNQKSYENALKFHERAIYYLNQAIKIANNYFSESSPILEGLKLNLSQVNNNLNMENNNSKKNTKKALI